MILYRCVPWNSAARHQDADGALWIPREYQGGGRHDNPDLYGCLYLAEHRAGGVVEWLARFRNHSLEPSFLHQRGLPLAVAALEPPDDIELIDLDDPVELAREGLRPSRVATRDRQETQPQARGLFSDHPGASGLRWWSTFEASWINVTLFDRAIPSLRVRDVRVLTLEDPSVVEAAHVLGLA